MKTGAAAVSPPRRHRPAWGKIAAAVLVLAALAALWRYTPVAEYLTVERIREWARLVRETPWAPVAVILAYTPASLVLFPRPLITLLIVVAFGPWLGIAYAVTGIMLAAMVTYYLGRALPRRKVREIGGDKAEALGKGARRHGVIAVVAFNLLPVPPFAVQNMIAGAVRIKVWEYALGSVLSLIPAIIATAVFGNQVSAALDDAAEVSWWAIGAAAIGLAIFIYFGRRWAAKQINR
ncbi:MAG: putative Phospholipase/Transphosphatidylase [Burkholderiales bacterium]|nr:putative Phospholipase/Transphosphatidylase [Burkholderiales bacterium]